MFSTVCDLNGTSTSDEMNARDLDRRGVAVLYRLCLTRGVTKHFDILLLFFFFSNLTVMSRLSSTVLTAAESE